MPTIDHGPYRSADVSEPATQRSGGRWWWLGLLALPLMLYVALVWTTRCTKRPIAPRATLPALAVSAPVVGFAPLRGATGFVDNLPCVHTRSQGVVCWGLHDAIAANASAPDGQYWSVATPLSPSDADASALDIARVALGRAVVAQWCTLNGTGAADCMTAGRGREQVTLSDQPLTAIASRSGQVCAIDRSHRVFCSVFGPGARPGAARELTALRGAQALQNLGESMCVLTDREEVQCWGWTLSSLGRGTLDHSDRPYRLDEFSDARQVAMNGVDACVLTDEGRVRCGSRQAPDALTRGLSEGATALTGVTQIANGELMRCALHGGWGVTCWGSEPSPTRGELLEIVPFRRVVTLPAAAAAEVAVGARSACARLTDNRVWCWGSGATQRLYAVEGVLARQVVMGHETSCALGHDGRVWCWRHPPCDGVACRPEVEALSLRTMRSISIDSWDNRVCGVQADGEVVCESLVERGAIEHPPLHGATRVFATVQRDPLWGIDRDGTLLSSAPSPAVGLRGVADVAIGLRFVCATHTDGTVSCWGDNSAGQLGRGWSDPEVPAPVRVFANAAR